jgi:hypothetical protein
MTVPGRCDHCAEPLTQGVRYCPKCGAVVSFHTPTGEAPVRVAAFLLVQEPGRLVRKVPLVKPIVRIGRGKECEVPVEHQRISRLHAALEIRDGQWHILDAKSTGGTFVDGRPVHDAVLLRSGNTVRLGREPGDSVTIVFHLGE